MGEKNDITIEEYAKMLEACKGKQYVNEWGGGVFGEDYPGPKSSYYTELNIDSFKLLVDGIGDMNPLYRSEEYAKYTKYCTLIAPPCWPYQVVYGALPEKMYQKFGTLYTAESIEYYLPVADGDRVDWRTTYPIDVRIEESPVHGTTVVATGRHEFKRAQGGAELARQDFTMIYFEMAKSKYRDAQDPTVPPEFTKEFIKSVYDAQDAEKVAGSDTRYWEDVNVGDKLLPVVRGPFTKMECAAWLKAAGNRFMASDKFFRIVHKNSGLGYYHEDLKSWINWIEPAYDGWAELYTQVSGSYIGDGYASQRSAWAMSMISNWMSDEGFLWKFRADHLDKGGYHNVFYTNGEVVGKGSEDGRFYADIAFTCKDQTGRKITEGEARVLLRSKETGGVIYPRPDRQFGPFFK